MLDREKVIKGFECCTTSCEIMTDCPYWQDCHGGDPEGVSKQMLADALALLREQESVEPVKEHEAVMNTLACGVCHARVALWCVDRHGNITKFLFKAKYCPECGRRVKWYD